MELTVEPLKESEVSNFTRTYWEAFEPPEADMILPMLYPNGWEPVLQDRLNARILRQMKGTAGARCYCAKNSNGDVIGVSWWITAEDPPKTQQEIDDKFQKAYANRNLGPPIEGFHVDLDRAFFKAAYYSEAEVMRGQPYMSLRLLAVSPKYQRSGAGSLLLRHGLEKADRLGLPVYLDSGVSGKALYERHGFEVQRDFPIDCTEYGGRSQGRHWCMLRPARTSAAAPQPS